MRRFLKRMMLTAAAVMAAAVVYAAVTLPPRALTPAAAPDDRLVWGAYHVHSSASDGSGSFDDIAAAAARAGLQFVIFTDHSDATAFESPAYRAGVLCVHATEINTESGHVVALGLDRASPYPLAGEARDVVEDIHRMGGGAIAAHPESPRPNLRWRGQAAAVDGFEWFNADSEWRTRGAWEIAGTGLRSLLRAPESLAALFRTPPSFSRWDRGTGPSPMFSIAALDAHARAGADSDGAAPGASVRLPSYLSMFRTVAQAVRLDRPLTGDAATDSRLLLNSIRDRRSYAIVRGFANVRAPLRFEAANGRASGEVPGVENVELRLLRNGQQVATGAGRLDSADAAEPGDYRLEARIAGRTFPWIVSDVIRIAAAPASSKSAAGGPSPETKVSAMGGAWQIEKHATSTATLEAIAGGVALRYRLGDGSPAGQYVALSAAAGTDPIAAIRFTGSSRQPMRISVQVRVAGGADGQRWRRSVYLDATPREIIVDLSDMQPVDRRTALRPIVARVQSVLIVIDTLNAKPGSAGEVNIRDARFVHGGASQDATSAR
ncbi:MAG TPA: PHP domain-containing protein [Vicinamibacterales bacterium]|nr:PHP domain-containing protein [Vicinamibacterales bacterium]